MSVKRIVEGRDARATDFHISDFDDRLEHRLATDRVPGLGTAGNSQESGGGGMRYYGSINVLLIILICISILHTRSQGQDGSESIETDWIPLIKGEPNKSWFGGSDEHSGLAFKLLHTKEQYCSMQLDVPCISLDASNGSETHLHFVFAHGQRILIDEFSRPGTSTITDGSSNKSMIQLSLNPDQLGMLAVYPIERILIRLPEREFILHIASDDLRQKALQKISGFYNRIEERK